MELMKRDFNLKSVTRDELSSIWGIGMKTASCFIMHSRPDAKCAGLDTHVLKYLRDQGIEAPSSTPTSRKKYLELEQKFLGLVPSSKTPAEFDLDIWLEYSGHRRL
jgi:thermostable 8-oxoguanine DNA glycosylase